MPPAAPPHPGAEGFPAHFFEQRFPADGSPAPVAVPGTAVPGTAVPGTASRGRASVPLNPTGQAPPADPAVRPAGQPAGHPGDPTPPSAPRRRRTLLLSVFSVVALLLVAAGVTFVARPGPVAGWLGAGPSPTVPAVAQTSEPPPPQVLKPAGGGAPAPTAAGVRAAIGTLVSAGALGPRVNISVVDVADGTTLYSANPERMTIPASTTKLVTAAAVLAARGPAYRLSTRVVAGAKPGEVVIVGGGDPTLAVTANKLFPGAARLDRLAAQVKNALGGVRPTRVLIDGSLFTGPELGPGWDSDIVASGQGARITALSINGGRIKPAHRLVGGDPRFTDPSRAAGQAFARALGLPASAVASGSAPKPSPGSGDPSGAAVDPSAGAAAAPPPGTELGKVLSPPLIRMVDWMLQLSDNVLAEALARQVALAGGQPASFAGAAAAMRSTVAALGLPADESSLVDASGLSRRNRLTPSLLTDLLMLAAGGTRPELTGLFGGLPVAGWSGTLQDRYLKPRANRAGQGLVRAKTGTLRGIGALSGQLVTADGRLLVFAILADAVPGDALTSRDAMDRITARLVTCGCS